MTEKPRTRRTPLTEPMLINYKGSWQVCYQARGTINYERVTAWVFGAESTFFCKVGEQDEIIMLPGKDACMGDQFCFTIDRIAPDGTPMERLGGATAAGAADAAYEYFKTLYSCGVRLRNGARIMREQDEENALERRRQNTHAPARAGE